MIYSKSLSTYNLLSLLTDLECDVKLCSFSNKLKASKPWAAVKNNTVYIGGMVLNVASQNCN